MTVEDLNKIWSEGKFYYRREREHELGWSVVSNRTDKIIAYGDKNICCGLALILNKATKPYDGKDLIQQVSDYL